MTVNNFGDFAFGGGQRSYSFDYFDGDEIANSTTAIQCPTMDCEQVFLQNDPDSNGNITVGGPRLGELDVEGAGLVLEPGGVTGWIPVKNLNLIWHKDAADSTLHYIFIR